jgi:3-keto-5-aminohexanoate cleavage enzyme
LNLIINYTPTGMIPTKQMTPHVPVTVDEIVDDVYQAYQIGITMVHLHARDAQTGEPTFRAEIYGKIIEGIRRFSTELVVCVSLSGRTFNELAKRTEPLELTGDLKPDMGSLTLSSLNFNRQASVNDPDMIQSLAREMKNRGILAELEAFDVGMINYAKYLASKNLLEAPHYFNLIIGNIACAQANLLHCGIMVNDLPEGSLWSIGGVGDYQLPMNSIAIAIDGGVRVGLEDNVWFDPSRKHLATNQDLLNRIHRIAESNERAIMPPAELRSRLNLEAGQGKYGRLYTRSH